MITVAAAFFLHLSLEAAELPPGGREMLPSPDVKVFAGRAAVQGATAETVLVEGRTFTSVQRLVLPQPPAHPWDAGATSKLNVPLVEGEVGLVLFEARALPLAGVNPADAEAAGTVYLERSP